MARKYKHPSRWLRARVPIRHGLTEAGAKKVAGALIRQKRREGFKVSLKKGKLRFTKSRRSR
jgi:hypothetical protein